MQGDREEFNQCQTQLKMLYREIPDSPNEFEFTAYRLLYYISMNNDLDVTSLLSELSRRAKETEIIKFALSVRRSWALGLYSRLFQSYLKAPMMCSYVMDLFIERERTNALRVMLKAYRPSIPVSLVLDTLGFTGREEKEEEEAGMTFLSELEVLPPPDEPQDKIDTRKAFRF